MNSKKTVSFFLVISLWAFQPNFLFAKVSQADKGTTLASPDGKIRLIVKSANGNLSYSIEFNKAQILESSHLGLTVNGKAIGENSSITKIVTYSKNESYPYRGVHSLALNKFKGAKLSIRSGQSSFGLELRVFNDGVAFRYLVSETGSAVVDKEETEFVIPAGSTVWSQNNIKYYEGKYSKKSIEDFVAGDLVGPPMTILLPDNGGYAAITEGGLTYYAGMSLIANGSRSFKSNLTGITKKQGNFETPWRIIEIGKDLNTLVNCDIVANVSPAYDPQLFPAGYNTDWVKPGRSVWSWLAGQGPVSLENMKRFSDMAADLGFEYNLVDEGWGNWKDGTRDNWDMMKELVDYSAKKGVKIWVWKAYPDRRGIAGIKDPQQRRAFFQKCKDLGIAGMKVDFFDSEAQEIVDFYHAALKDAAEYHLMMNFHGSNKPTGEARTWPNEMSREGIKGLESRPAWAQTTTMIPFTRYLAGHADFTPIHFGDRLGEVSWAHHVASMVVVTSPFLCVGADPVSIKNNPAGPMIKSIPPVWDETIVLPQSKIGDLVLYARRKGDTWFLAAMNGVHQAKELSVNLSFLKKGQFKLFSINDDKSKQEGVIVEEKLVTAKTTVTIRLNAEGGFVGRFEKQ